MRTLEVRQHAHTKHGGTRGRGSHLSQEGVEQARSIGASMDPTIESRAAAQGANMADDSRQFTVGDPITVLQGPYTDFKGIVIHASPAPGKVGVKLAFFGRK